jgi:hypothetical protein
MASQRPKSLAQINTLADKLRGSMTDEASGSKAGSKLTGKTEFGAIDMMDVPYGNLQELYTELLERYRKAQQEKEEMVATADRRTEAYMRKELQYKEQLDNLEERVDVVNVEDKEETHLDMLRDLHSNILDSIGKVQTKTSGILKAQERDLIRAFRARLADVTDELEKERKKNESGSVEWVQRCRKLTEELEWLRDLTEKLTSENKSYLKDNKRFKRQLKTQEEDREFLIKQLVTVKKENARLRHTYETITGQQAEQAAEAAEAAEGSSGYKRPGSSGYKRPASGASRHSTPMGRGRPRSGGVGASPGVEEDDEDEEDLQAPQVDREGQYKRAIDKLKRQVEDAGGRTRQLRTAYTQKVAQRTELQNFLKRCIEDVRTDLFHRTKKVAGHKPPQRPSIDPRAIPPSQFSPADRITVMEWLIAQDHVIYMLYDQLFPREGAGPKQGMTSGRGAEDMADLTMGMGNMGGLDGFSQSNADFAQTR